MQWMHLLDYKIRFYRNQIFGEECIYQKSNVKRLKKIRWTIVKL